jgi:dTDP-4-amino-4,6-dideoxygalactose transaminase
VSQANPEAIPFHRPAIGDREIAAAVEVLRSGWLTTGRRAHELEERIAGRAGVRHALAVNSATAAMHLALEGWGIGPGDEVIIPTYTFTACGEVCAYLGARPVLADVGEDYLLSADAVEAVRTDATRAATIVHFGGQAVDTGPLRKLFGPGVRLLEDAAHAFPADVDGMPAGRLGDAAALSFYATKTMTTGGEGGMLLTDDDALAARAARMRLHGISADAWNRYGAGGQWFYEVSDPGFKYNLTDLAAAIGLVQLDRLDELTADRARIAARYDELFASSPVVRIPPRRVGDGHAWHLYVIQLELDELSIERATVIERMGAAGIGTSVHFIPLHLHPWYQRAFGYRPGDFPMAERLYERSLSLPIWPGMTDEQVARVASTLLEICDAAATRKLKALRAAGA